MFIKIYNFNKCALFLIIQCRLFFKSLIVIGNSFFIYIFVAKNINKQFSKCNKIV